LLGSLVKTLDGHGGNIYGAAREQHCRPSEWLDFSANINPLGPPGGVLRVLRNGLWAIGHYPDPDAYEVRNSLSKQIGLSPDWLLVGNGSAELIHLLPLSLGITKALVVGPTFSEYDSAIHGVGAVCTLCFADRHEDYRPPIDRVIAKLQKERAIDAVFLCNPNSPTGQVVTKADLFPLIDVQNRRGGWMIIDEAFGDFAPDHSLLEVVPQYPRLLILRSGTKFYGIPGLRLGYLVGHPAALRQVHQRQAPWSVNALAQIAAVAALQESGYAEKSLSFIEKERKWLQSTLQSIAGVRVFPSAANFLLLELPSTITAGHVTKRFRETGILIRDCSNVPGLNERTIRIAIKRRADNERLCRALQTILYG
jgi:threonine-phosphate decarboxylase